MPRLQVLDDRKGVVCPLPKRQNIYTYIALAFLVVAILRVMFGNGILG